MNTYLYIVSILAIFVLFKGIGNFFIFSSVIIWLKKTKERQSRNLQPNKKVFILLPVYKEQALIKKVIQYYNGLINRYENIYLIIIPSKKEDILITDQPTTEILAKEAIKIFKGNKISILKYPKREGFMAHQLNYASKYIQNQYIGSENWLFLINIDSVYSTNAVEALIEKVNQGGAKIHQFSAIFLNNFSSFKGFRGIILKSNAIFQSRWTITHELKRYIVNSWQIFFAKYQFTHAVGHGLLLPVNTFNHFKLVENTPTEDSPFGFLLRIHNFKILPSIYLEYADSPNSITDLYRQKYVWSFGPLWYPFYLKEFFYRFPNLIWSQPFRVLILFLQGNIATLNWLFSSWIFIFLAINLFFVNNSIKTIIILAFLSYFLDYIGSIIYFSYMKILKLGALEFASLFTGLFIVIITHSFPANLALFKTIQSKFNFEKIKKYKTSH